MTQKLKTPGYVIQLARGMRISLTYAENLLWEQIRKRKLGGYRFRCQHPVYRYILDFYCHEKKLAVEVDGEIHNRRKDYDEYRDMFLQGVDIKTLRISNREIENSIDNVLKKIYHELETR
ncbi:MAG: hypothetical protein CVV44_05325 [Spirochaetae bacterium HGW-Spirochaetae-1]|jgi:very-short-patch-repair endonuclease|nr:MAG: hypothetical protein CVV44_05325 [Spirochaetae bacterium HGW-Spirochaetae-1]